MKKISSLSLSLALAIFPVLAERALAQEATTSAEAAPAPEAALPEPEASSSAALSGEVQATIPSENLESADNPQDAALEEALRFIDQAAAEMAIVAEDATTTAEVIEIGTSTTTQETIEMALPEENHVAKLQEEVLVPKKEFTFEITGEAIAAKENPEWTKEGRSEDEEEADKVIRAASLSVEPESRALEIRGSCSDAFYAVLVYKNEGDYDANPASYIYNKAFPCVAGSYAYALSQLPFNLETGRFYLLIAGQGNDGPWKPITALMPVGITVTTTYVPAGTSTQETP